MNEDEDNNKDVDYHNQIITTDFECMKGSMFYDTSNDCISIADSVGTISIGPDWTLGSFDDLSIDNWYQEGEMFVDNMPPAEKLNDMAEQYPSFAKAYERFKYFYDLVKDDYENQQEKDAEVSFGPVKHKR